MYKLAKLGILSIVVLLVLTTPALAETTDGAGSGWGEFSKFSKAIGAGLVCIGSAYGIGKLASSALESMARQPEVAGNVQTAMIIAAALIEGFTFYALFICSQQT